MSNHDMSPNAGFEPDDLVKRLRESGGARFQPRSAFEGTAQDQRSLMHQAADEIERLAAAKRDVQHTDTMNDMVALGIDRDSWRQRTEAAEAKLDEQIRTTEGYSLSLTEAEQQLALTQQEKEAAEARVKVLEVALEWFARGQQAGTTTLQQQGFARQALAQEQER